MYERLDQGGFMTTVILSKSHGRIMYRQHKVLCAGMRSAKYEIGGHVGDSGV